MPKIFAVEYEWTDEELFERIALEFAKFSIETVSSRTHYISEQHERSCSFDFWVLDGKHWHYPDDFFESYIRHVASKESYQSTRYVCLGEAPFGYEMPPIGEDEFLEHLYKRTKLAADILRMNPQKDTDTLLVSPAISIIDPKYLSSYLDFFIDNRQLFDIYAVHCEGEMHDQNLAFLSSFLAQVIKVLKKPVWVTKWTIPSCDHQILHGQYMTSKVCLPASEEEAARQLRTTFNKINAIAGDLTKWFFTGIKKDDYYPNRKPPSFWDGIQYGSYPFFSAGWSNMNFTGIVDYNGNTKRKILETLFDLNDQ